VCGDHPKRVRGKLESAEKLMLGLGGGFLFLIISDGSLARNECVGAEGLELDGVGPGLSGRLHQGERGLRIAVVVDAGLGYDVDGTSRPNPPLPDIEGDAFSAVRDRCTPRHR
jgi:hypothetical protein